MGGVARHHPDRPTHRPTPVDRSRQPPYLARHVAAVCVVVADLAGVLLMLPKTWADPWSETAVTFGLAAAAGLLAAVAVGRPEPGLLLYPAYFGLINLATTVLILSRRRRIPPRDIAADGRTALTLDCGGGEAHRFAVPGSFRDALPRLKLRLLRAIQAGSVAAIADHSPSNCALNGHRRGHSRLKPRHRHGDVWQLNHRSLVKCG